MIDLVAYGKTAATLLALYAVHLFLGWLTDREVTLVMFATTVAVCALLNTYRDERK